jgi:cyanophycinase-like exopeptidase
MDADVIASAGARSAAVLAGAARVGSDYTGASARARRHYAALDVEVWVIPDPRDDVDAALTAMRAEIDLVILPGGSPSSLLDVLAGPVRDRLLELHAAGTSISGASAGAMVMCSHMVRPDRGDVVEGLGLIDGLALPHWNAGADPRWSVPDVTLWGLPECGGVIIDNGAVRGVGAGAASVKDGDGWHPVPP